MKKQVEELSDEQLAILNQGYPQSDESNRTVYPRLGMLSKDDTEESGTGKSKKITVIEASGTFFTESDKGETDDKGKKKWTREYLKGEEIDVIIAFERKRLRMYDSNMKKFYTTPFYDSHEQVLPLYLDKKIVKRGLPSELQALFPKMTQTGKKSSNLKEETILFVLLDGEMYMIELSMSSKWNFMSYKRKVGVPTVVTTLGTVEDEFGSNTFRKLTFTVSRKITAEEFELVKEYQGTLKDQVESDARQLANSATQALPAGDDGLKEFEDKSEEIKKSNKNF